MSKVPIVILIGCALSMLVILVAAITDPNGGSANNFKVRALGPVISIQDVGFSQVRILGVDINDRPECRASSATTPIDMKLGDVSTWWTMCGIVSVTITTTQGTETYTLN